MQQSNAKKFKNYKNRQIFLREYEYIFQTIRVVFENDDKCIDIYQIPYNVRFEKKFEIFDEMWNLMENVSLEYFNKE